MEYKELQKAFYATAKKIGEAKNAGKTYAPSAEEVKIRKEYFEARKKKVEDRNAAHKISGKNARLGCILDARSLVPTNVGMSAETRKKINKAVKAFIKDVAVEKNGEVVMAHAESPAAALRKLAKEAKEKKKEEMRKEIAALKAAMKKV